MADHHHGQPGLSTRVHNSSSDPAGPFNRQTFLVLLLIVASPVTKALWLFSSQKGSRLRAWDVAARREPCCLMGACRALALAV